MDHQELARTLNAVTSRGFEIVLLRPRAKKPDPGIDGSWNITRDVALIESHVAADGNIGIVAGEQSGLAILDEDKPELFAAMETALGPLARPWVETGRGRRHFYIAWSADLPAKLVWNGQLVGEIQRGGSQDAPRRQHVVAPPSIHPDTGRAYHWLVDPQFEPLTTLPQRWREHVQRPEAPSSSAQPKEISADRILVLRTAASQQPGARPRNDGSIKFQCPACASIGKDEEKDNAILKADGSWGCAGASGTQWARIHWDAIKAVLTPVDTIFNHHERKLVARTFEQIIAEDFIPPIYQWPKWCVNGRLYIYTGAGDSMKSWLLLYEGLMTAAGRPMFDDSTPCLQGPAILVSAENGYDEDKRRIQILSRGLRLTGPLPFTHLDFSAVSLRDDDALTEFLELVKTAKPRFVGIDSAIAVADLENENDNAEVQRFMREVVLPLSRIHGATTKLIAHSPKPPTHKGLVFTDEHVTRGASAWRNAVDGVLYLRRDPDLAPGAVIVRQTKVRVGRKAIPFWFTLEDHEIDSEGNALAVSPLKGGDMTPAVAEDSLLHKATLVALRILQGTTGTGLKELSALITHAGIKPGTAERAIKVIRGKHPWPGGPHAGKTDSAVNEEKGLGKGILLALNSTGQHLLSQASDAQSPEHEDPGF